MQPGQVQLRSELASRVGQAIPDVFIRHKVTHWSREKEWWPRVGRRGCGAVAVPSCCRDWANEIAEWDGPRMASADRQALCATVED